MKQVVCKLLLLLALWAAPGVTEPKEEEDAFAPRTCSELLQETRRHAKSFETAYAQAVVGAGEIEEVFRPFRMYVMRFADLENRREETAEDCAGFNAAFERLDGFETTSEATRHARDDAGVVIAARMSAAVTELKAVCSRLAACGYRRAGEVQTVFDKVQRLRKSRWPSEEAHDNWNEGTEAVLTLVTPSRMLNAERRRDALRRLNKQANKAIVDITEAALMDPAERDDAALQNVIEQLSLILDETSSSAEST